MKNYKLLIAGIIIFTALASAQVYNNPSLPRITAPQIQAPTINNNTVNVNNSNCWQGDCGGFRNFFDQDLNKSNNVQHRNISATNISILDWIFGKNLRLDKTGTAFFPTTSLEVVTQDVGSGLISLIGFDMNGGAGIEAGFDRNGKWVIPEDNAHTSQLLLCKNKDCDDVWIMQNNNNSGIMEVKRFNPFTTATIVSSWNMTNINTTSNHQTYNVSSSIMLDTTYTNSNERVIYVSMDLDSFIADDSSSAYTTMYVNGSACSGLFGINDRSGTGAIFDKHYYGQVGCYIQPTLKYSFNTSVTGSGSVVKGGAVRLTVI